MGRFMADLSGQDQLEVYNSFIQTPEKKDGHLWMVPKNFYVETCCPLSYIKSCISKIYCRIGMIQIIQLTNNFKQSKQNKDCIQPLLKLHEICQQFSNKFLCFRTFSDQQPSNLLPRCHQFFRLLVVLRSKFSSAAMNMWPDSCFRTFSDKLP